MCKVWRERSSLCFLMSSPLTRKMEVMPILQSTGTKALQSKLNGATEGEAPQYAMCVEDDYLTDPIEGEAKAAVHEPRSVIAKMNRLQCKRSSLAQWLVHMAASNFWTK
jgi:hypothetical protein